MNIKELAEQVGLGTTSNDVWYPLPIGLIHLERFAELVAAAEREKCAKAYEPHIHPSIVSIIRPKGDTK